MEEELQSKFKDLRITMALEIAARIEYQCLMDYIDELQTLEEVGPTDRKQIAIIQRLLKDPTAGLRKRVEVGVDEFQRNYSTLTYRKSEEVDTRTEEEIELDDYFEGHLFDDSNHPNMGAIIFESQVIEGYRSDIPFRIIDHDETWHLKTVEIATVGFTIELWHHGGNDNEVWKSFYEKVKTMQSLPAKEQDEIINKILCEPFADGLDRWTHLGFGRSESEYFDCKVKLPNIRSYYHIGGGSMHVLLENFQGQYKCEERAEYELTSEFSEDDYDYYFDEPIFEGDVTTSEDFWEEPTIEQEAATTLAQLCASENISLEQITKEKLHKDTAMNIIRIIDPTEFVN